jgi:hypothetical protein
LASEWLRYTTCSAPQMLELVQFTSFLARISCSLGSIAYAPGDLTLPDGGNPKIDHDHSQEQPISDASSYYCKCTAKRAHDMFACGKTRRKRVREMTQVAPWYEVLSQQFPLIRRRPQRVFGCLRSLHELESGMPTLAWRPRAATCQDLCTAICNVEQRFASRKRPIWAIPRSPV